MLQFGNNGTVLAKTIIKYTGFISQLQTANQNAEKFTVFHTQKPTRQTRGKITDPLYFGYKL
jgi:hypothetical protein